MKKNWFKRMCSISLALVLTVGLCACGGGDGDGGNAGGNEGKGSKGNANSALAKENVYKVTEIAIPKLVESGNGYVNAYDTTVRDGIVYTILDIRDWTSDKSDYRILSVPVEGGDVQLVPLQLSEQEDEPESTEAPDEGTPDEEGTVEVPVSNTWDYVGYGNFTFAENGTIFGIKNSNHEDYSDPEKYISEQHTYICSWSADGSLLWEKELEELARTPETESGEWIYIQNMLSLEDGTLRLLLTGDNAYKMDVAADGTVSAKEQLPEETANIFRSTQAVMPKGDGTFSVIYNDENDWSKSLLVDFDFETGVLGEPIELPSSLTWNGFRIMEAGKNSDLLYSNNQGIFTYNKGDAEGTIRMNFINSDVNITNFSSLVELDDQSFFAVYNESYEDDLKAAVFTYVDPATIADKEVVVLAGNYINNDKLKRVIEYNRASDKYRVVVKSYDSYNSYDDYNAGITKLNNDIITGGMPDILLTDGLPVENYISKGLIADINKLIEADEELSQVEFLQNVMDAYSVDGKLYYVIPSFQVVTMVAKTSLVGDGSDWSMEKMKQVLAGMGEGAQAIGEVTRDGFMSLAMQFCGGDFIDVKTGKCSFDSQDFIDMMEFAKTLPEEIDWGAMYEDGSYWESYESQYRSNKTLLLQLYVGSFRNLSYSLNGYLGEDFTFVGFPTQNGGGAYINSYDSMVLSAKSKCLEGAWDFARYYLTDEYQEQLTYGLSVNKRVFLEQSEQAMKRPTYTDYQTQEEVEYDETMYINGEEIIIPPLSEAQKDQVVEYLLTVDTPYHYNTEVLNIINEEVGAFYAGQKSAKDAATIIQSRAQLYVDENR